MSQDLEKFGMPEEELFAPVDHSDLESEKITAPRSVSYTHLRAHETELQSRMPSSA